VLLITNPAGILNEMIITSSSVLTLCIELCAVYTVWLGFLELVDKSGLGNKLAKLLKPIIRKILKVDDEETQKIIALNLSANMLGLGNASTPLGIKAVQMLDKGETVAPASIIMFIIINVTSLQLLPTTIIGIRETAGSTSASDIIIPTLIATFVTTFTGIILALFCEKIYKKRRNKL
jgi:spore maturation protein A